MATDAGLSTGTGAGFTVNAQQDRAIFTSTSPWVFWEIETAWVGTGFVTGTDGPIPGS